MKKTRKSSEFFNFFISVLFPRKWISLVIFLALFQTRFDFFGEAPTRAYLASIVWGPPVAQSFLFWLLFWVLDLDTGFSFAFAFAFAFACNSYSFQSRFDLVDETATRAYLTTIN